MSYSTRASRFANAAFVVQVDQSDFAAYGPNFQMGSDSPDSPDSPGKVEGIDIETERETSDALKGMYFQQYWEKKAYLMAGSDYSAPAQSVPDFLMSSANEDENTENQGGRERDHDDTADNNDEGSEELPDHIFAGKITKTNLNLCLPKNICDSLKYGLRHFGKSMPGLLAKVSQSVTVPQPSLLCRYIIIYIYIYITPTL